MVPASPGDAEFSMTMPSSWKVLDLRPGSANRSVDRMVRDAVGRSDQRAALRRSLSLTLRRAMAAVAEAGGFFAASYNERVAGFPLSASVIALIGRSPLEAGGPVPDAEAMVAALSDPAEGDVLTEGPQVVDLRLGPAVRTRARVTEELAGAEERPVTVDMVRFFVPVPEWDRMVVMVFSTPMVHAADAMARLFDEMANSARWR